jgi:hypothetical protein
MKTTEHESRRVPWEEGVHQLVVGTPGNSTVFDRDLGEWVKTACREWGWPEPGEEYHSRLLQRLRPGLRSLLTLGLSAGLVQTDGWRFTLKGLVSGKGPYRWFSKRHWMNGPHPNWEYFVQVAEFVRLHRVAVAHNLRINFEDGLMDLTLSTDDGLLLCVEVKERLEQLRWLIAGLRRYETAVDQRAADRGNDPLRKAKYIVNNRPQYFCGVALGARLEYRVDYPSGRAFQLSEDFVPCL